MLVAAGLAFWRGWKVHTGETAILAYGLGLMALLLAAWYLTRKDAPPRTREDAPPRTRKDAPPRR